jgi:hypothetical protein
MENQTYYGNTSFPEQKNEKIYGRSSRAGKGCFGIIGAVILLIGIIIGVIYFGIPALTPNSIHGDFMSMAIVPQKDGSQKLWILTDGSFNFIQTKKSPGSYSTGRKCYFCKTWTYIYDPETKKVLKKIKTEQQDIITRMDIFYYNGKVWQVTGEYGENEPKLDVFDAETTEKVMDTKAFISKFPVLEAGLVGIRYDEKNNTIVFKTKDGKEQVIYSIDEEKIYEDQGEYSKSKRESTDIITTAVLSPETSSSKKFKLYTLTGPKGKVESNKSTLQSFALDKNSSSHFTEGITIKPTTEKGYLEGILYYDDKDCGIVIYLDQIGRKSDRIMTCVDLNSGKEKWTAGPDLLFKEMKINEDKNTFSSLFFTKDHIKVRRSGNLVILELQGEGIIGFDYETGKKLWEMSI